MCKSSSPTCSGHGPLMFSLLFETLLPSSVPFLPKSVKHQHVQSHFPSSSSCSPLHCKLSEKKVALVPQISQSRQISTRMTAVKQPTALCKAPQSQNEVPPTTDNNLHVLAHLQTLLFRRPEAGKNSWKEHNVIQYNAIQGIQTMDSRLAQIVHFLHACSTGSG